MKEQHRILGIDPGTLYMGYALLDTDGNKASVVLCDALDVHKIEGQWERLKEEFFFLQKIIEEYRPDILAIESQFVDKNPQTMIKIVHAQGIAIAAALSHNMAVFEYSPLKVKMSITGNGHATKEQLADMLQRFLHLETTEKLRLDATDALGIAYCHFLQMQAPASSSGTKSWKTYAKRKGLL